MCTYAFYSLDPVNSCFLHFLSRLASTWLCIHPFCFGLLNKRGGSINCSFTGSFPLPFFLYTFAIFAERSFAAILEGRDVAQVRLPAPHQLQASSGVSQSHTSFKPLPVGTPCFSLAAAVTGIFPAPHLLALFRGATSSFASGLLHLWEDVCFFLTPRQFGRCRVSTPSGFGRSDGAVSPPGRLVPL